MSSGASWSEDAYSITVELRTPKTIIVEGKTDKGLIDRFLVDNSISNQSVVVDSADMFAGDKYRGLGNRTKVLTLWQALDVQLAESGKVMIFVDREWTGLFDGDQDAGDWFEATKLGPMQFQTLGHSHENYGFDLRFIDEYIKHYGAGIYTEKRRRLICSRFCEIISLAAAFSLAAKDGGHINRCNGVVALDDILVANEISFRDSLTQKLGERGINEGTDFLLEVYARRTALLGADDNYSHLLAHGHLGEDLIWSCIAALLVADGADYKCCNDLAFGRRDERLRCFYGWLTNIPLDDRRPIDDLMTLAKAG